MGVSLFQCPYNNSRKICQDLVTNLSPVASPALTTANSRGLPHTPGARMSARFNSDCQIPPYSLEAPESWFADSSASFASGLNAFAYSAELALDAWPTAARAAMPW